MQKNFFLLTCVSLILLSFSCQNLTSKKTGSVEVILPYQTVSVLKNTVNSSETTSDDTETSTTEETVSFTFFIEITSENGFTYSTSKQSGETLFVDSLSEDTYTIQGYVTEDGTQEGEQLYAGETTAVVVADQTTSVELAMYRFYTITLNANYGDTPETATQKFITGQEQALTKNTFTRDGYIFKGWSTDKDATQSDVADEAKYTLDAQTGNVTLYAVWALYTYTDETFCFSGTASMAITFLENLPQYIENEGVTDKTLNVAITIVDSTTTSFDDLKEAITEYEGIATLTLNLASSSFSEFATGDFIFDVTALNVVLPNGLKTVEEALFVNWVTDDDGELSADENTILKSVVIGDSATAIGTGAFYGCTSLESVTIGSGVKSIGDEAFSYCSSLKEIEIPSSVTSIGESAFAICEALESITIPGNVESIGAEAFVGCTSLKSAKFEANKKLTLIPDHLFYECGSLASVELPEGITTIGKSAFNGCALTSITIPSTVTTIENKVFRDCKFTSITIPKAVLAIGSEAFYNCENLKSVTFENTDGWYCYTDEDYETEVESISANLGLSDSTAAATYLTTDYVYYYWYRSETATATSFSITISATTTDLSVTNTAESTVTVGSKITFTVDNASDYASFIWSIDDEEVEDATSSEYTWTVESTGVYTITVVATTSDNVEYSYEAQITVE